LFWWLLLVLVLFAIHQNELAMERTRVYFSLTLEGRDVLNEATAVLDGRPVASGDNISLSSHHLTVTHPKTEPFTTNFSGWYGRHELGRIPLTRARGNLNVTAEPAAKWIAISGPEFSLTLSNSTGTNVLVPTDAYQVSVRYARWAETRDLPVSAGRITSYGFNPQFGVIALTGNALPAAYEILDSKGNFLQRGDVPVTVTEVPSGRYEIQVAHGNHQLRQEIVVSGNQTNDATFHFAFGAARFESTPPGAGVYATNGIYLGTTPVTVTELPPATADYRLQLNGYERATVTVTVVEDQTNSARATLVSQSYLGSMQLARQELAAGNYRNALYAVEQALIAKPGDAEALNLQTTVRGRAQVQEAKDLAKQGDYLAAGKKLAEALATLPEDAEAKSLQAEYQPHEAEQVAKIQQQKTRELFDRICQANKVASLFEAHEVLAGGKSPEAVRDALVQNCETVAPTLKVTVNRQVESGLYELALLQASDNPLVTFRLECLMVIGTGKDSQTVVRFKLLHFVRQAKGLADLALNVNNPNEWVPLHSSRMQMTEFHAAQIRASVQMMQKKINDAIQ
jgi:tetratricopeptide (TPR) repeat protein